VERELRALAASLRAAVEVEAVFEVEDLLVPSRSRPPPRIPAASPPAPAPRSPRAERPAPPPGPPDVRDAIATANLDELREIVAACRRCPLHETRNRTVFGAGRPDARLMVVGEAPGADEDRQGEPFVGRAGQLLTRMLAAIDLRREDVFIGNVLKCRPPGNRNPEAGEIAACLPHLERQIELVRPAVILALGSPAARTLLRTREGITRLRGRIFPIGDALCVPSFHPAYLLRNPAGKREAWTDLKLVRRLLDESSSRP
jgi:DNA polymerase